MVLEHFWTIATAAPEHLGIPLAQTDLVVVCHTLPERERQACVNAIRAQAPAMLVVKENGYDSGPHANADATVDVQHGPGALVSTIYGLITERGLASRGWVEQESRLAIH